MRIDMSLIIAGLFMAGPPSSVRPEPDHTSRHSAGPVRVLETRGGARRRAWHLPGPTGRRYAPARAQRTHWWCHRNRCGPGVLYGRLQLGERPRLRVLDVHAEGLPPYRWCWLRARIRYWLGRLMTGWRGERGWVRPTTCGSAAGNHVGAFVRRRGAPGSSGTNALPLPGSSRSAHDKA